MLHVWNSKNLQWQIMATRTQTGNISIRLDHYRGRTPFIPGIRDAMHHQDVPVFGDILPALSLPKYVRAALVRIASEAWCEKYRKTPQIGPGYWPMSPHPRAH